MFSRQLREVRDWDVLLAGSSTAPPLPGVRVLRRLRGMGAYVRASWIYRRKGFGAVREYLFELQKRFISIEMPDEDLLTRMALREIGFLRVVGRSIRQDFLCLPDSVTLAAGLIAAGFPVNVMVGRTRFLVNPAYDFHAWVELAGTPLNEFPHVRRCFWLLLNVPEWKAPARTNNP